jgi:hypothetical protein
MLPFKYFIYSYMMLIDGTNEVFMIDRDNSVFHVSNLEFPLSHLFYMYIFENQTLPFFFSL